MVSPVNERVPMAARGCSALPSPQCRKVSPERGASTRSATTMSPTRIEQPRSYARSISVGQPHSSECAVWQLEQAKHALITERGIVDAKQREFTAFIEHLQREIAGETEKRRMAEDTAEQAHVSAAELAAGRAELLRSVSQKDSRIAEMVTILQAIDTDRLDQQRANAELSDRIIREAGDTERVVRSLQTELEATCNTAEALQHTIDTLRPQLEAAEAKCNAAAVEVERLTRENHELSDRVGGIGTELAEMRLCATETASRAAVAEAALEEAGRAAEESEGERTGLSSRCVELARKCEELAVALTASSESEKATLAVLADMQAQSSSDEHRVALAEHEARAWKAKCEAAVDESVVEQVQRERDALRAERDHLRREAAHREDDLAAAAAAAAGKFDALARCEERLAAEKRELAQAVDLCQTLADQVSSLQAAAHEADALRFELSRAASEGAGMAQRVAVLEEELFKAGYGGGSPPAALAHELELRAADADAARAAAEQELAAVRASAQSDRALLLMLKADLDSGAFAAAGNEGELDALRAALADANEALQRAVAQVQPLNQAIEVSKRETTILKERLSNSREVVLEKELLASALEETKASRDYTLQQLESARHEMEMLLINRGDTTTGAMPSHVKGQKSRSDLVRFLWHLGVDLGFVKQSISAFVNNAAVRKVLSKAKIMLGDLQRALDLVSRGHDKTKEFVPGFMSDVEKLHYGVSDGGTPSGSSAKRSTSKLLQAPDRFRGTPAHTPPSRTATPLGPMGVGAYRDGPSTLHPEQLLFRDAGASISPAVPALHRSLSARGGGFSISPIKEAQLFS